MQIHRVLRLLGAALASLVYGCAHGQPTEAVQSAFRTWASQSLHEVAFDGVEGSTSDLRPIGNMIGKAKIVALSEAVHGASEPLLFRNRLFKYLVEEQGFTAIAIESGVIEGRAADDYIQTGAGDLQTAVTQGFSWGFDTFRQNRELIQWMREYNAQLAPGRRKIRFFGFDVPGSPGNPPVTRGLQTGLEAALDYLTQVDPASAATFHSRVDKFIPALKKTDPYGLLSAAERDALTAAIADLNALIERRRADYIARSSLNEYEWGKQSGIGARQADNWLRLMPLDWVQSKGFAWTEEAMQARDRAMQDNLEWIVSQLDADARILVFGADAHLSRVEMYDSGPGSRRTIPFGTYARARFGDQMISILNLVAKGEIAICSTPRRPIPLKQPSSASIEHLFASLNVPRYVIDLRTAPRVVSSWLHEENEHWLTASSRRLRAAGAFDIVFFVSPVTSACVPT